MTNLTTTTNTTRTATYFTYDHFNKTINGSELNFKKSGIPGSAQYDALMEAMSAHPTYSLAPIAPKVKKQTYAGLNFDLMMEYVECKGTDIQKAELEEIVNSNSTFPVIKSWFVDNFKVGFTVEKAKREIAQHKLGARKSKVRATVKATMKKAAPAVLEMPIAQDF